MKVVMLDKGHISHIIEPKVLNTWIPKLVAILLCIIVVLIWWMSHKIEQAEKKELVKTEAALVASYIKADMRSRIPSLQRIVNRWQTQGGTPKNEFTSDAKNYIFNLPGFQAIEWVDTDFYIRWVVPLSGNEKAQDLNVAFEDKRRIALEKSRELGKPIMTDPIDLVQGGKGVLVYFPIFVQGEFDGFLLAVFRLQEWMDYVLSTKSSFENHNDFNISVSIDGSSVFEKDGWGSTMASTDFDAVETFDLMGHRFTVYCRPTEQFFQHNNTAIAEVIVGIGFFLAFLIAFVVSTFQKATIETWRAHSAKEALETTIQELSKTQEELQNTTFRSDFAAKAGNVGIWTWDVKNNDMSWNSIMYELYDIPSDVMPTYATWQNSLYPEDASAVEALLDNAVQGKTTFKTEFRIILTNGSVRHINTAAKVERDTAGKPIRVTGISLDITKQKRAEEKIQHLANHDALTGLPNLRLAKDRALMAMSMSQRNKTSTAILFIDLDGFKDVNDSYGHEAGDVLLKEVSARFLSCVREMDTVARIGGDEFLIILTELHRLNDAENIAKKLIKTISQDFMVKGSTVTIGASIGISHYPLDGQDLESLMKQADNAMYDIKKSGKNGYGSLISKE
ncbi:MAG: diguanylate cyclase [Methylococcaceae bacterium]|nr:diguanylate cyclase [Methylococcaceae bacterium]